jgi:hypothetical protein
MGERERCEVTDWESDSYKRRQLSWIKMAGERHQWAACEEKRKEEVLGVFEGLVKLSSRQYLGPAGSRLGRAK